MLELKILSPQEDGFIKEIKWNHEEIKEAVASKMKEYTNLVYTEETIKEAKRDKAHLNKFKDAIETERKRIKKQCMEPYELFEAQVKEITRIIDEPIRLIDAQIKEVEEQKKIEKKGKIFEIYEASIGTLKGILPFDRVFKNEYLNVSKSLKSITEEIQALIARVKQDMDTIEELHTKYELQVKDVYIRTLDLATALHENARLDEVEKRIAERKAKEQEALEKAEQERMEREAAVQEERVVTKEEPIVESVPKREESEPAETTITIDFRVTATKDQFQLLKEFLVNNHITYGPVPR